MRIYSTSDGLDPAGLVPGEDLVLELDPGQGLDLPAGVLAHDYLGVEVRRAVDEAAQGALAGWRSVYDRAFTVDGVCLPWIWEIEFFVSVLPKIRDAVGLREALAEHSPESIMLMDPDPGTAALVSAVAERSGTPVTAAPQPSRASSRRAAARPERLVRRLRRAVLRSLTRFGAPSFLRPGSVVFISYWPLTPLLDRMLSERRWRPAVALNALPPGPGRSLRAARRGGWVGLPSTRMLRIAARRTRVMVDGSNEPPELDVMGLALGPSIHRGMLEIARARAATDVAGAVALRRAFRWGRVSRLVAAFDAQPPARLVVSLAQEAGIPTLVLAHGAYLLPRPIKDMQVSDEVALWSRAVAPPMPDRDCGVHVVGYPLPHRLGDAKSYPDGARPARLLVLGQAEAPLTALIDARLMMRNYVTALDAATTQFPEAIVVLRPHPGHDIAPIASLQRRYEAFRVELDVTTEISRLLEASDLCIGGTSTATLQAALAGTPVVVLNVTGFDWNWPLGGDTSVPVARSEEELRSWLARWSEDKQLPGRSELLDALGVDGQDPTERILAVLEAGSARSAFIGPAAR